MGIFKRPDSRFWWLALERPKQRPIREATRIPVDGGTTSQTKLNQQLAQEAYAARMGDLARARYQLPTDRPLISFADFRTWYYENVSVHKRNTLRERSMLKQIGRFFDRFPLHQIDRAMIMEWRTARAREVAAGTVNREQEILRHMLSAAVPKYLETNPASGLSALRVTEHEVRLLEPAEEVKLLKVANVEERAIILLALDTLQRLSNVAGLKRAQDHGTYITVLNPKVRGYKVPVSARLRKALDAHAKSLAKKEEFYFPGMQGKNDQQRRNNMIRMFEELLDRAGLPRGRKTGGLSFHCLRHTGASRMLARGVDVKTVRDLGGWQNLDVLQKYLHPTDAQKKAAVETVGTLANRDNPQRTSKDRTPRHTRNKSRAQRVGEQ